MQKLSHFSLFIKSVCISEWCRELLKFLNLHKLSIHWCDFLKIATLKCAFQYFYHTFIDKRHTINSTWLHSNSFSEHRNLFLCSCNLYIYSIFLFCDLYSIVFYRAIVMDWYILLTSFKRLCSVSLYL